MKYKLTAEIVSYVEDIIEANNENEAWDKFNSMLDNGEVTEVSGECENKQVIKVK